MNGERDICIYIGSRLAWGTLKLIWETSVVAHR